MQLRMEFGEKLEDIRPAIATLEQAIDELLGCEMLKDVLEVALTAGNIINGVSELSILCCVSIDLHSTGTICPGWQGRRCLWDHCDIPQQAKGHQVKDPKTVPAALHQPGNGPSLAGNTSTGNAIPVMWSLQYH